MTPPQVPQKVTLEAFPRTLVAAVAHRLGLAAGGASARRRDSWRRRGLYGVLGLLLALLILAGAPSTWAPSAGAQIPTPTPTPTPTQAPECSDGTNNDGGPPSEDTLVDAADPGCESDSDTTESPNPSPPPQCADGLDNDGDGRVDFSGATAMAPDPDCSRASDTLEGPEPTTTTTPPPPVPASGTAAPQCADGGDNDGDGKIDLADPGCTAAGDTTESPDPTTAAAAADGDGDGEPDEADRCPQTPGTSSNGCPAQLRARTSLAFQGTGAGIRLAALSVTAPSGAAVEVRCGRGCRRLRGTARGSRAVGFKRLRGRLLRFGTKLEVRVTMSNRVGDYVAYAISRQGVKKTNGCIRPGASRVSSNCD